MEFPSWLVWTGATLRQLISNAGKVKERGGMGVYPFHGVGGQIIQISKEAHKAFLDYLKMRQHEYWVTTFSEAKKFVTGKEKKKEGERISSLDNMLEKSWVEYKFFIFI